MPGANCSGVPAIRSTHSPSVSVFVPMHASPPCSPDVWLSICAMVARACSPLNFGRYLPAGSSSDSAPSSASASTTAAVYHFEADAAATARRGPTPPEVYSYSTAPSRASVSVNPPGSTGAMFWRRKFVNSEKSIGSASSARSGPWMFSRIETSSSFWASGSARMTGFAERPRGSAGGLLLLPPPRGHHSCYLIPPGLPSPTSGPFCARQSPHTRVLKD